jgi:hypothetical protein
MPPRPIRRSWLFLLMALCGSGLIPAGEVPRPTVGAIRWDAWSGGSVTAQVEKTLGPARFHQRLPWFAQVTGPDAVSIAGGTPEVMDREISFAADAGLDYWAFLLYPSDSPMSGALAGYLASPVRHRLGFCLILHSSLKVSAERWPAERDRAVALLGERGFQRLPDGRLLVYIFCGQDLPWNRLAEFTQAAATAGHHPYLACMAWNPRGFSAVKEHGIAAMSAYAVAGDMPEFAGLVAKAEADWTTAAQHGVPWIPLVTTGWDKQPRQVHPVTWEPPASNGYRDQKTWPAPAAPAEIAAHLQRALAFVETHSAICPARTVIIYAWNEYDEGGWLAPTRAADGSPDTSRLDALRAVLRPPGAAPTR